MPMIDIRAHGIGLKKKKLTIAELKDGIGFDNFIPFYTYLQNPQLNSSSGYHSYAFYDKTTQKLLSFINAVNSIYVYSRDNLLSVLSNFALSAAPSNAKFIKAPSNNAIFIHDEANRKYLYKLNSGLTGVSVSVSNILKICFDEVNSIFYTRHFSADQYIKYDANLGQIASVSTSDPSPTDMCYDSGYLYVLLTNSIKVYDSNLNYIRTLTITDTPFKILVYGTNIFVMGSNYIKKIDYNTGVDIVKVTRSEGSGVYLNCVMYKKTGLSPLIIISDSNISSTDFTGSGLRIFDLNLNQKRVIGKFHGSFTYMTIADDALHFAVSVGAGNNYYAVEHFVVPLLINLQ